MISGTQQYKGANTKCLSTSVPRFAQVQHSDVVFLTYSQHCRTLKARA